MLYQRKNPHGGDIYQGDIRLDFSANTNPLGTPEGVLEAIAQALPQLHRYPDPYCRRLVQAISDFEQVPKGEILCGNGAAELIYGYCRAMAPKRAMELAPTFSEYSQALAQVGCHVDRYGLQPGENFTLGADFLEVLQEKQPDVLFLCNPNNPTGQLIPRDRLAEILQLCRRMGCRVFLDECFMDLCDRDESMKGYLAEYPELLILKAFTKSYGMAGIRLGYCLSGNGALLEAMSRQVQPWNVSLLAQAAGVAALGEQTFLQTTRELIFTQRQEMQRQLEAMGLWVCPSHANYLLFRGKTGLDGQLRKQAIAIRNCGNYYGLEEGWYRVAVRRPEENRQLLDTMRTILERG